MADPLRVVGLMSGTSLDLIDAALVEIATGDGELELTLVRTAGTPWPADLRDRLAAWADGAAASPAQVAEASMAAGAAFADAVESIAGGPGAAAGSVDLVASHGQTIAHMVRPDGAAVATVQVGEPAVIAERTGLTVVADFRPRDIAAGGQGAPLVSFVDALLGGDRAGPVAFLNLGGVANVTVVPSGDPAASSAWDTGPGNGILDALARRLLGASFDRDGAAAAAGTADEAIVSELLAHPFFAIRPPKSSGRETFGAALAARLADRGEAAGLDPADILATATELTARSIATELRAHAPAWPEVVYVSGGGTSNPTVIAALERALAAAAGPDREIPRLAPTSELGVPADAKEAVAFAVLGHETLHGRPSSLPGCTGARHSSVLGAIWPGNNHRELLERVTRAPAGPIGRLRITAHEHDEGGST